MCIRDRDLADELQLQDSLNVIYKTLEDTIKAMDNVPGMMSEFSKALGNFTPVSYTHLDVYKRQGQG